MRHNLPFKNIFVTIAFILPLCNISPPSRVKRAAPQDSTRAEQATRSPRQWTKQQNGEGLRQLAASYANLAKLNIFALNIRTAKLPRREHCTRKSHPNGWYRKIRGVATQLGTLPTQLPYITSNFARIILQSGTIFQFA